MAEDRAAIAVELEDDVVIVRFRENEVREATFLSWAYEELSEFSARSGVKMVFLLDNVEFISSAGVSMLLWLAKQLTSVEGRLNLCEAQPDVLKVLEIGRLDQVLNIYDSRAEAIAAFERGG